MRHFTIDIQSYEIGDKRILRDVSLVVNENDRIAVVGPNGAGKTTFLRVLAGVITEYSGSIENTGGIGIGYVEQVHFDDEDRSVRDELRTAFPDILATERDMREYEAAMSESGDLDAIARYTDALDRYRTIGGYQYEGQIVRVAQGLGLAGMLDRSIREVSGGQRTKIALAKVLLLAPDFLLLDEPTNFIDLASVEWLEDYLIDTWKGGYCIISHDRAFLDRTCRKVLEFLPERAPNVYHGNYTDYVEQKSADYDRELKLYELQKTHIDSEKALINRFRAGSRAGMAKSRGRALDKLDVLEAPERRVGPKFRFESVRESPDRTLLFRECFIGRKEPLFYIDDLELYRKQRVGIVGENGVGKSTFLKTILGEIDLLEGKIIKGKGLEIGYYSQMHEELARDATAVGNFEKFGYPYSREKVISILSNYGFTYDQIDTPVRSLSWGQTSKLLFAILGQRPTNFLIFDEPTNHLDYESREALEHALSAYEGTILFISHDRYFVNKIASHMWVVEDSELRISYGNYDDYRQRKELGLSYDTTLYDEDGEMDALLEAKLGTEEAKRIKKKYARRK